ncbi:putative gfo/Idh/MocA family oxidoreductase [Paenibacillus agaridevorans]|uniref:Putative gfo/Idh/MocA family oxidoreductase n=1 Tax=Paenibacillus agaridevorans TaxID=171404 RepID=A0A2R5EHH3_9BACL|nr:putative gfo/Idh/MocA family oxidoreductase [Paenibacillus agaridevorans]
MLKVAIIGAGAISTAHIEGYLQFRDRCQIVAVSDVYPEKALARIEQFGIEARAVQDYKELLEGGIDIVSVCTPPYTHADIAVDFLNAGSHVIIEKPMASSLKECDEINEAASRNGKLVSVIAQNRFRNPMMKLKTVLESGLAGATGLSVVVSSITA